jgi:hypothetical protein
LRHHVAGNVCQSLARRVNYQVTPEVGKHLDGTITTVLKLLDELLTAFVAQKRMKLPGSAYRPCYRLVA